MRRWFGIALLGGVVALISAMIYNAAPDYADTPGQLNDTSAATTIAGLLLMVGLVALLVGLVGAGISMVRK